MEIVVNEEYLRNISVLELGKMKRKDINRTLREAQTFLKLPGGPYSNHSINRQEEVEARTMLIQVCIELLNQTESSTSPP